VVAVSVMEADQAASRRDWPEYFRLMREAQDVGANQEIPQPPPEHTSADPWPLDFVAPPAVVKLRQLAEGKGWEVRLGYSRAYLKLGRGYVRAHGRGALWVLHHLVQVGIRRPGGGLSDAWIIYRQDAGVGTGWAFHAAGIGRGDTNVTGWKTFVNAGAGPYAGSHDHAEGSGL
jgi:hypothetical protein